MDHTLLLIEDLIDGTNQTGESVLSTINEQRRAFQVRGVDPSVVEVGPTAMRGLLRYARRYFDQRGILDRIYGLKIRPVEGECVRVIERDVPTWEPK